MQRRNGATVHCLLIFTIFFTDLRNLIRRGGRVPDCGGALAVGPTGGGGPGPLGGHLLLQGRRPQQQHQQQPQQWRGPVRGRGGGGQQQQQQQQLTKRTGNDNKMSPNIT